MRGLDTGFPLLNHAGAGVDSHRQNAQGATFHNWVPNGDLHSEYLHVDCAGWCDTALVSLYICQLCGHIFFLCLHLFRHLNLLDLHNLLLRCFLPAQDEAGPNPQL